MVKKLSSAWRWSEGEVNRLQEHFELRYGSAEEDWWNEWLPVALVGPPSDGVFSVQFLVNEDIRRREPNILSIVTAEINFYLVELGERDPWAYLQYHCGTASNIYSRVHWAYFNPTKREEANP